MNDDSFKKLLEYFHLSWDGYRKVRKGVKKRIARHLQVLNLDCMDDYLELIERDENVRKTSLRHLTVSISRFYRDRILWERLGKEILPVLLNKFSNEPKFRVWSCGCARGEEAYGFLMLWESLIPDRYQMPDLEMIATDMNPEYLKKAKEGIYEFRSLRDLPKVFVEKYFNKLPDENRYRLHPGFREMITFMNHNFIEKLPPLEKFHIIFVRNNLLTYYNLPEKIVALSKIINSLSEGGVLIIGSQEKIPDNIFCLKAYPGLSCLHFKEKIK